MGRKIISGYQGKAPRTFIGTNEFCNTEWNFTEMAEEEETTNSCSGGFNQYDSGNLHVEGHIKADWDISANPFLDPPELRAGQKYSFQGYIHSNPGVGQKSGPYLSIERMIINNLAVTLPSKGKVTYEFDFKSDGPYKLPTEASGSSSE